MFPGVSHQDMEIRVAHQFLLMRGKGKRVIHRRQFALIFA
jgi:hypothetical protein